MSCACVHNTTPPGSPSHAFPAVSLPFAIRTDANVHAFSLLMLDMLINVKAAKLKHKTYLKRSNCTITLTTFYISNNKIQDVTVFTAFTT